MYEFEQTDEFMTWLRSLRDLQARARIEVRLDRIALGNFGQVAPIGEGISEAKIDYGPGYRIYFTQSGKRIILLLCGGDKSSQRRDIERAKHLAESYRKNR